MKSLMPSRGMISGEMSWAFVALCFAISGSPLPVLGSGYFYRALVEHASPTLWAVSLGAPAIALFALGVRELSAHRSCICDASTCWTIEEIEASARWRGRLCLVSILGWFYMLKVQLTDLNRVSMISVIAAGACVFMWMFYKENRRVRREIRNRQLLRSLAPAG